MFEPNVKHCKGLKTGEEGLGGGGGVAEDRVRTVRGILGAAGGMI